MVVVTHACTSAARALSIIVRYPSVGSVQALFSPRSLMRRVNRITYAGKNELDLTRTQDGTCLLCWAKPATSLQPVSRPLTRPADRRAGLRSSVAAISSAARVGVFRPAAE